VGERYSRKRLGVSVRLRSEIRDQRESFDR
jgi:hypothetical protein